MQGVDIRPLKQRLRAEIKEWRRAMAPEKKQAADARILRRVTGLREYASCGTVLTYVSKPIEVDTIALIERALADGKRVAAPRCVEGRREMEIFLIRSLEDLAPQTFGVLEPVRERCALLESFEDSICIVPALAYDRRGYRLGYGAGYYDRFLSLYTGPKIGVIYAHNLRPRLWHGRYDVPVDLIVTESRLFCCAPVGNKQRTFDR
ncbi:5-formyltetrahydrofolate cyclo-ligase [Anaerotruncus colihominis]|uniref:5-formyltetrahydrofolate cyclo-ligase n=1 Tax=Anaerotruncus colihominis TaxID=169435 RepID=UPI003516C80E